MTLANPFVARRTAERYARGRPYHHERTLARVLNAVPVRRHVAIDVAAGTGLSTRALAPLGFFAVGVEPVPAMLAVAPRSTTLSYALATAEALPVGDRVASLVTASSAVHWFDQRRFFDEARRVLHPDGIVIVYEHAGVHLPGDDAFSGWAGTEYVARYPTPPRGTMAGRTGEPHGLRKCFNETWVDSVDFTHDALVDYLTTQSNVVDAIESGRESEEAVRSWLSTATARFFTGSTHRAFGFFVMAEAFRPG